MKKKSFFSIILAFKRWQQLKREFQMRKQPITIIPKIPLTIRDIDDLFLEQKKSSRSVKTENEATNTKTVEPSVSIMHSIDDEENVLTEKEKIRQTKEVEEFKVQRDDEHDFDDDEPRSKFRQTTNGFGFSSTFSNKSDESASVRTDATSMKNATAPKFCFSMRLKTLSISQKNSSVVATRQKYFLENVRPSNSKISLNSRQDFIENILVSSFECRPNLSFLIAATPSDIILFQQSLISPENYHLGRIKRRSNDTSDLNWHDGAITSMNVINETLLSIYTNSLWFVYNFYTGDKSFQLLRKSGVDDTQTAENSDEKYRRGIGTVHQEFSYHLYLSRNDVWMLSKNRIKTKANAGTFTLSSLIPNVQNFLDITVNDQAICFLVEIDDSYAVIFCSLNTCQLDPKLKPIVLTDSTEPMKICSGYSNHCRQYFIFVNEPSKKILHILSFEEYLYSYPIDAYSMSYVHDTNELIFVSEKAICSLKFN